jgi:hypothetical protein
MGNIKCTDTYLKWTRTNNKIKPKGEEKKKKRDTHIRAVLRCYYYRAISPNL